MIEIPEALHLAGQINEVLTGKRISLVIADHTPHKFTFYSGDTSQYENLLVGKTITQGTARGGMVEIKAEDALLILTDGVVIRYYEPDGNLPDRYQMLIGFEDNSYLVFSVRMYGGIWCIPENRKDKPVSYFKGSLHEYYEGALNKPQVLSDAFSREYFMGLIQKEEKQKKSLKAFLATEQTIPGLGNGVLQDILYIARLHPKKKVQELTQEQKERLFQTVKENLKEVYQKQGRNTETDLFGKKGEYIPFLSKDTAGKSCNRCDSTIQKESYLGGSIYYCPGCQKL
ncbi:MAG: endonuclease VIII [Tannerellaceae bacterium]|nr:endonuclease VIII [Tannerellaceae bacterium]